MPSVHSNTIAECKRCSAKVDLEDPGEIFRKGCPVCGHDEFLQIAVVSVCDFCSTPVETAWTYPCKSFLYDIPEMPKDGSKGDWAACDKCHDLIEAGDHRAVIRRAVAFEIKEHPEQASMRHQVWSVAARIHKGFYENRTGAPPFRESQQEHRDRKEDDGRAD